MTQFTIIKSRPRWVFAEKQSCDTYFLGFDFSTKRQQPWPPSTLGFSRKMARNYYSDILYTSAICPVIMNLGRHLQAMLCGYWPLEDKTGSILDPVIPAEFSISAWHILTIQHIKLSPKMIGTFIMTTLRSGEMSLFTSYS